MNHVWPILGALLAAVAFVALVVGLWWLALYGGRH